MSVVRNKIYFFHDDEGMGQYFSAKSFKDAKNMALISGVCDMMDNPFTDIRGYVVNQNSKTLKTDIPDGSLSLLHMSKYGLLWFCCDACESDDIKIVQNKQLEDVAVCNKCDFVFNVPSV